MRVISGIGILLSFCVTQRKRAKSNLTSMRAGEISGSGFSTEWDPRASLQRVVMRNPAAMREKLRTRVDRLLRTGTGGASESVVGDTQ